MDAMGKLVNTMGKLLDVALVPGWCHGDWELLAAARLGKECGGEGEGERKATVPPTARPGEAMAGVAHVCTVSVPTPTRPKFRPEMDHEAQKNGHPSICVGTLGRVFCPL